MKKSIIKSITLGIGGLLSLSFLFGLGLNNKLINKKDNNNALETNVNNELFNRKYINTEGSPLPTSGTLSTGTYYLSSNLTVSSQLKITSGNVIVNLNGYTLNGGGRDKGIFHLTGGALTVNGKDDETGNCGTLNNGGGYYPGSGYSYGGALYITAGGATFNDLSITNCQSNWGGAIYMSNSAVTLNNCNFSGNTATNGYGFHGAISVDNCSTAGTGLTVNGGEMFSNDAAIYVGNKAKATINGTYIHDNETYGVCVATNNGEGGLTITGNTIIKNNNPSSGNLRLNSNNVAKVGILSALGNDAYIGVTIGGDTKGVFTSGWSTVMGDAEPSDYFFSDDNSYSIDLQDGEVCLREPVASVSVGESVTKYSTITSAVSAWTSAASGATLTLLKDVTISSTINVSTTKTLDLNGYGINASGISSNSDYAILVNNGGNLTLNDSGDTTHYFTHERYKGYDAGLATVCDQATYNAASADSRGTFAGGYLTGLSIIKGDVSQSAFFKIEENSSVTMNGGTIIGIYADYSSSCVCSNGTFIMNGGNMIYNVNARGCINARTGILTINGGNISHNTDKNSKNTGRTAALWLNNINNPTYTIRGGTITDNVAVYGAVDTQSDIAIEGNPVIKDNIGVGTDENSDAPMNIVLSMGIESKLNFIGEYTGSEPLGVSIYMDNVYDVTNSADVSFNNKNNVVSDNPNYGIGVYPSNHAKAGQLFYIGVAAINVIDAIDGIDPMSYDGGKDDSLNDIVVAISGYNNLPQNEQDFVDGINKDVLDHDALVYKHVDNVGDLIKAIPTPSSSDDYIDAVNLAKTEYDKLTDEEEILLNSTINFEQILIDHQKAAEVIEQIISIGDVTYNGGQDDSKDDIEDAQQAYDDLTDEQKELVDQANKDDLDDAKETYEKVDDAVHTIEEIGDINHGGENDSKDKINTARNTYDQLTDEQKDLVKSYKDTYQDLNDAEKVYTVLEKIDEIGEVSDESSEKIKEARELYDSLSDKQKEKVNPGSLKTLKDAEDKYNGTYVTLFIILLIIAILLLIAGLVVLYFLIKDKNKKKQNVANAYSFAGFLPLIPFASAFTSTKFIIVYIIFGLALLVWCANVILFVSKKRQKEAILEAKTEAVVASKLQVTQTELVNEDDEVETIKDEKGNIFQIRFIKSFTAKLIQSPDETKKYYEELKNEVLSYRGTHSRTSWHFDSVNAGRNYVLKFAVRGKTLCVYLPLNANGYADSKYKVEKVESKKFEEVPCLYRIKNDRRLGYAKELIAMVASNLGLEKGEEQHEVYSDLPYEENKPLVARGLIKELKVQVQDKKVIEKYESISAAKADEVMSDEQAEASLEEIEINKTNKGAKTIINIDTLSAHFNNNDEVTLESLIEKKLVPSKTGHIKVLARGVLDKTLHVVANEYSLQAVKMIILLGGSVKKVK